MAHCWRRPGASKNSAGKDGRAHWDVENRKIWIQQAQRSQLGGASEIRPGVYSVVELEQAYGKIW